MTIFDKKLIDAISSANHIVVFTGAGVSAESGIPTFRDAQTGLWEKFDVTRLASSSGFKEDKDLVWGWYEWRRMMVMRAKPNAAHQAIVDLAENAALSTVITQNVDDLHERAGSKDVVHLHGSLHQPRCFACGRPYVFPEVIPDEPTDGRRLKPPKCNRCNGYVRPGVVWFGESLPEDEWYKAEMAARDCDVFFCIGTSSVVFPAAELPKYAAQAGAVVVQINPEQTSFDKIANYNLYGKAGEILPALVAELKRY